MKISFQELLKTTNKQVSERNQVSWTEFWFSVYALFVLRENKKILRFGFTS